MRDTTLVVVTADHGEEFQEHGHLTHGSHLYEESVHVPLVLVGPGVASGRRADEAQGIDLYPTLAAFLGGGTPPDLPGRDLLATRAGQPVIVETNRGIGPDGGALRLVAVRDARWKLIHTPALGRFELYDLGHDPAERDDRWPGAGEGDALAALIADWAPEDVVAAVPGSQDPAFGAKLRALGYVE